MADDSSHLHDPEKAAEFARALGLSVGGHHPFVGDWLVKGLYAYRSGKYKGQAYFGTGGSESDRLKDTYNSIKPGESHRKYRPWNRDDPKIPEDIRQKLIRLEDRINRTRQPFTKPSSIGGLQGEISLKGVHGKYLSATPEGRVLWNTDVAHVGEYFRVEQRQNGKIALRSAFDMYVSAQPDGSVQINRREAYAWEEFTVEYRSEREEFFRSNDVVYLKSCHGKYLSAQKDGTEWWDWTMRQEADAQEIQIQQYPKTREPIFSEPILNSDDKYLFAPEHMGWHWHNDRARAMGGHIASVTSAEENEQITRISGGAPVWLGGIRKGPRIQGKPLAVADRLFGDPGDVGPGADYWHWSDGRPWTYTNWGPGEPNNWDAGENRVQHLGKKFDAVWNDVGEDWDGPAVYRIPAESIPSSVSAGVWGVHFQFIPISEYDEVWNDKGSGARVDVSVWKARVPRGCHLIGMTAKKGHSRPNFSTLVIRADGSDIAPPERFELVWWQERGQRRFWCWRPIPPPGYVSLGDVGSLSENPPSLNEVVCVSMDCLSQNTQPLGSKIWDDSGGGAPKDAAFFSQPGDTGLFHCSDNTHNKPHGEFHLPAATSTSAYATESTALNDPIGPNIEILQSVVGKPVRFRINDCPSDDDAWVGIYPASIDDFDHGSEGDRWKWLKDIDENRASFPEKSEGRWSIRVFQDRGYNIVCRVDFEILPKKERWWED